MIKSASHRITLELYNEGKTIAEIARLRSLTVGTVLDHLRQCVAEHTLTAVRNELDSETLSAIKGAVDKVGSSRLKAIKAEVGDHVSYAAIRLALLVLQCGKD